MVPDQSDSPALKPMIIALGQLGELVLIFYNTGTGSRDPAYPAGRLPLHPNSKSSAIKT
jgi:hypothetical protein